jgi:penicillin-binding protein 1A
MIRARVAAFLFIGSALTVPARADLTASFWDLQPRSLQLLAGSSQVMVTRTESGWDAYCRCPVILTPAEIPEAMKKAIIAVEDKRFFDHSGVDLVALLSVVRGGLSRGGSTIPMQLLKNLVLHDLRGRGTLARIERKRAEVWHAGAFDEAVGKEELLAAYLNQIEFGGRDIVGLYRASRHFFRKEPKDLTLYEAALLAGMVQAPARFNPLREQTRQRAHERALLVLRLMQEQGMIGEAERRRAVAARAKPGILPEFRIQPQAFTEWVVQTWGERHVRPGETVRFFVTLDARLQHSAEQNIERMRKAGAIPSSYDVGSVVMAPNGRVQAMIGSVDWSKNQFNNAAKGRVQAGSTAKLPLVVAACERGISAEDTLVDRPVRGLWPSNGAIGFKGKTTLKEAIATSRNAAAVRLADDLGADKVAAASRRLGLEPGTSYDSSLVLGAYSTNVLQMTSAYATIASGGNKVEPSGVLAVVDGRGTVRADFLTVWRTRVVSPECVEQTRAILREVVETGTGRGAKTLGAVAFGKTGTSTGNADAWFVGWSGDRVIGTWMGRSRDVAGPGLSGADAPAAFFRRVVDAAAADEERRERLAAAKIAELREQSLRGRPKIGDWFDTLAKAMTALVPPARDAASRPRIPLPPVRPADARERAARLDVPRVQGPW